MSNKYIYVFYRGESVQFVGTDSECSEHFGMNLRSVHWHATPTARRRANQGIDNNKLYAEKVEAEPYEGQLNNVLPDCDGALGVSGNGRRHYA